MRRILASGSLFLLLIAMAPAARAQAGAFLLRAYGEVLYSHYDYGPDQKSSPTGAPEDSRAIVDIPRVAIEMKYWFQDDLYFESEIEFEHGGTGSALELEYEEFGEFEFESEKGGEVVLEELHVTKAFAPAFNARLGHFLVAVGLTNRGHSAPTQYFSTVRPESETALLPSTWHETGAEVFGTAKGFAYRAQVVNGLDATGFSSANWIAEGIQQKFEQVRATDLAFVGRLDYVGTGGLLVGGSVYYGNSTGNRPKPDMAGIDGHVTIGDVHATVKRGPVTARACFMYGTLENADLISQYNANLSRNLQVPRTPVASDAMLYYGEIGYDVLSLFTSASRHQLIPFARYDYYNSMEDTDPGIFPVPRFERQVVTGGLNFFMTPNVVLKADYSHRTFGDPNVNDENTVGIALGFVGDLFHHQPNRSE